MGALSHFLESEGLATAGISLIRVHSEQLRPPRALWVPFELGRPFGAPDEPAFQRRVLEATLDLFKAKSGPVLEDFPDDPPAMASAEETEGWVCPVSFAQPPTDPDDLGAAVAAEIGGLAPWYEEALRNRGRTTVGASEFTIEDAAEYAVKFLETPPPETGPEAVIHLKGALEDLKAFYGEAAAARPGASSGDLADWLWRDTALGRLIFRIAETLTASDDPELRDMGERSLVPRAQAERAAAS